MSSKPEDIWNKLELETENGFLVEKLTSLQSITCFLGIVGSTKARLFQLELSSDIEVYRNHHRKFRGVDVQVIPKKDGGRSYTIILLDQNLSDVFTLFVEDLIDNLKNSDNPKQALEIINLRVNYWRKLFARANGQLLSAERQRGLYGELYLLRLLLESGSNPHNIVDSWTGPEGSNQDFTFNQTVIEVKTSLPNHPLINVSNEEQLNYVPWEGLFLYLLLINETRGGDQTLSGIIRELIELMNGDLLQQFENKLSNVGIEPAEYDDYTDIGFLIRDRKCYKISQGFPIITRENLMSEQKFNVKYQIDASI